MNTINFYWIKNMLYITNLTSKNRIYQQKDQGWDIEISIIIIRNNMVILLYFHEKSMSNLFYLTENNTYTLGRLESALKERTSNLRNHTNLN